MNLKSLGFAMLVFFGLAVQCPSAPIYPENSQPHLVAVVNTNPADPLGGEIWLINLDGRLVRRITKNNAHEESPSVSPDGSKLAFVRNMGEAVPGIGVNRKHNEIVVYDLRTGVESRLTQNDVEDSHPEWSYDGKTIAFHSRRTDPEDRATLWIMESDGSRPRRVLSLQPDDLSHLDPVWGPDGQWLAFVCLRREQGRSYSRIEKVRVDGTQRTVVSSGGKHFKASGQRPEELFGDLEPAYSPDGAVIWSARRLEGGKVHLFTFGAGAYYGGKAETDMDWRLYPDALERTPRFSPDGRRIVLTRASPKPGARSRQLVLTDPQSSFRRYLTSRDDWDVWDPRWFPFTLSGVDRDDASRLTTYGASHAAGSKTVAAEKDGANSSDRQFRVSVGAQVVLATAPASDTGASPAPAYEARWSLDVPPEGVISLALRFEGRLGGDDAPGRSLSLQLMDWEEKRWVTVFAQPEVSNRRVKILHEIAPAHFINQNTREVVLRIATADSSATSVPLLEATHLNLDVRR